MFASKLETTLALTPAKMPLKELRLRKRCEEVSRAARPDSVLLAAVEMYIIDLFPESMSTMQTKRGPDTVRMAAIDALVLRVFKRAQSGSAILVSPSDFDTLVTKATK